MSTFSIAFNGATIDEQADDAYSQLKKANTGDEFKQILSEINKDPNLKTKVLEKISTNVQSSSVKKFLAKGKNNLIFTGSKNVEVYFKVEKDKSISDFDTTSVGDWDVQIYFDETLLNELQGQNDSSALLSKAISKGRIRFEAKSIGNKLKFTLLKFGSKIFSVFKKPPINPQGNRKVKPSPTTTQLGGQGQAPVQEKCPYFCKTSRQTLGNPGLGQPVPDCVIHQKNIGTTNKEECVGEYRVSLTVAPCKCDLEEYTSTPCPEFCDAQELTPPSKCGVDRKLVGKTNVPCSGHLYDVPGTNWNNYMRDPEQPACFCP